MILLNNRILRLLIIGLASASLHADDIDELVTRTQAAHNIEAWWAKEVVQADVEIVFGGKAVVDGTFTFQAHGPLARYDRADGASITFDGSDAWVTPSNAQAPKGRFHVLTWPWFIWAPFKMQGEGITLSDMKLKPSEGVEYRTLLQTFGADMGDTPDDWYRFYVNPETHQIDMMSYIVTYGKDAEEANKKPSIIKYLDYSGSEGPLISTRYEFWFWDPETASVVGDSPKGTGTISNIRYLKHAEAGFAVPVGARKLELPQ